MQGSFATRAVPNTRFTDVGWVDETGSTNQDLLVEAARGVPEGRVLVADHQTAGRGRLDRTWSAPPGSSLLVSVLLRPVLEPSEAFLVTSAAAVAACEACREQTACFPGIKWPNDLVVVAGDRFGGRKLAGILAESVVTDGRIGAIVVGLGLNVGVPSTRPAELADTAVSLEEVVGHPVDREAILFAWLRHLDGWLDRITTLEGRAALAVAVRDLSSTLGRAVRVELADRTVEGEAVDITTEGHLVVAPVGGGELLEVTVGDVVHLRLRN